MLRKALLLAAVLYGPATLDVDAESFTLTWIAPGDDGHVGTAAEYDLRYSISIIHPWTWDEADRVADLPEPQPAGSLESVTVDDLEADKVYYFALKAADEANNWSPMSNIVSSATCPEGCIGIRGNVNGDLDEKVNITDIRYLVNYLFGRPRGPAPPCVKEGNANGDLEEKVNISDLDYLVDYLFGMPLGPPPGPCP